MIAMHFHNRTHDAPWRCEFPAYALRSDSPKGSTFDLCRQLVARGIRDQPATVYRDGKPSLLIKSIYKAAKVTVLESERDGPKFTKWQPFVGAQDVVSRRDVGAPDASNELAATLIAPRAFVDPGASPQSEIRRAA